MWRVALVAGLVVWGCTSRSVVLELKAPSPPPVINVEIIQPLNPVIGKIKENGEYLIKLNSDIGSYLKAKLSQIDLKDYFIRLQIDELQLRYNPKLPQNNALARIEFEVILQRPSQIIKKRYRLQNIATIKGYRFEEQLVKLLENLLDQVVLEIGKLIVP